MFYSLLTPKLILKEQEHLLELEGDVYTANSLDLQILPHHKDQ